MTYEALQDRCRSIKDSKTFCVVPWIHLYVDVDGRTFPCLESTRESPLGDTNERPLREIWNSPGLRRLRLNMLEGKESPGCSGCYARERASLPSGRQNYNAAYLRHLPEAAATREDGSVDGMRLRFLNLRFSNVCNFRCRMCYPHLSSAWHGDGVKLGMIPDSEPLVKTAGDLWPQLEPHLDGLEQIVFAGGEPTIMDEVYQVLNGLIDRKLFHVPLVFRTNFSTTFHAGQDIMKLWARFERVEVAASLDALGRRGEYIRKGQDWSRILANRERMRDVCPDAKFKVAPTFGAMNVLHIPDMHQDLLERRVIGPGDLLPAFVVKPSYLDMRILPARMKARVEEAYRRHVDEVLEPLGAGSEADKSLFRRSVDFLMSEDRSGELPRFRSETRKLDAIRGESFAEVFPECAELMAG